MANEDEFIHDKIEEILFTNPGDKENLPEFGCGLHQLSFDPNSDVLFSMVEIIVQNQLRKWMGDLIVVETLLVDVEYIGDKLFLQISFRKNKSNEKSIVSFEKTF